MEAEDERPKPELSAGRIIALGLLALLSMPFWGFLELVLFHELLDVEPPGGDLGWVLPPALLGCATAYWVHRTLQSTVVPLLAAMASLFFVAMLVPSLIRARPQGLFTACKSNLKNCGTALEIYSSDFSGRYPTSMHRLTPNYLKTIPTCPAASRDTYSETYRVGTDPDLFTLVCTGLNHRRAGLEVPNYPQYTSQQSLIERP